MKNYEAVKNFNDSIGDDDRDYFEELLENVDDIQLLEITNEFVSAMKDRLAYDLDNKNLKLQFDKLERIEKELEEMDLSYDKEVTIEDEIENSKEHNLFKGLAYEVCCQAEQLQDDGIIGDISYNQVKKITDELLDDDYLWGNINETITSKTKEIVNSDENKKDEKEENEEEDEI